MSSLDTPTVDDERKQLAVDFRAQLENLINTYKQGKGSNTPSFILADYLTSCLEAFDTAISQRADWYGRTVSGEKKSSEKVTAK